MMQSILFGNGLNRVIEDKPSWDQLIKSLSTVEWETKISNTLKYEAILLNNPYRQKDQIKESVYGEAGVQIIENDNRLVNLKGGLTETGLKLLIAEKLKEFSSNEVFASLSKIPVDCFITTNYDHAFLKTFDKGSVRKNSGLRAEKIYSLRRNYVIKMGPDKNVLYWPIHGDVDAPASIMLGYDHYCGSLSKIDGYVKGNYIAPNGKVDSLVKRLGLYPMELISWIDLLFISDIHILGLNLGYEETDLWWLLNRRARILWSTPDLIDNKIYYYPVEPIDKDLAQLLSIFKVEVVSLDKKLYSSNSFLPRYEEQIRNIKHNVQERSLID